MKKAINIISVFLSFFPVAAFSAILKDKLPLMSLSNSIFSLILYAGSFFLIRYALKNSNKRLAAICVPLGLVFSVFSVCGANVYLTKSMLIAESSTILNIIGIFPLFYAVISVLIKNIPAVNRIGFLENSRLFNRELSAKSTFFIVWTIIFAAWLPTLLAAFPGMHGYDSVYQVSRYINNSVTSDHPPIHTYFLGFCVVTLGNLFGSNEIGMCIYSVFQMLCMSAIFSALYCCFIRNRLPALVRILILMVFMFLPINAIMSVSSTKDVIFSGMFAMSVMMMLQIAEKPDILKSKKFCTAFILVLFAMCIFRNQGIYVLIFGMLFAFVLLRKYFKQLLAITMITVIMFGIYQGPVCSMISEKSPKTLREMMSVPCVQLSRAMIYNDDEISDDEKNLISEYIPKYSAYLVDPGISDVMKNCLDTDRIKENPIEFAKLWIKVGIKCPLTYIDAFARLTIGLWYPDMNYRDAGAYHPYWEYYSTGKLVQFDENEYLIIKQQPVKGFERLNKFYYKLSYENSYQSMPVISMLFSSGFAVWCLLLYIAICIYRKKYRHLFPAAFITGLLLTLLLGPVVLLRYVYPIMLSVPLLFASAVSFEDSRP